MSTLADATTNGDTRQIKPAAEALIHEIRIHGRSHIQPTFCPQPAQPSSPRREFAQCAGCAPGQVRTASTPRGTAGELVVQARVPVAMGRPGSKGGAR
jgi:hypothetical protein